MAVPHSVRSSSALQPARLREVRQAVLTAAGKISDALAGFWFNIIVANWNRFIAKGWNGPAARKRRSDIRRFWNNVVVKRLLMPLTMHLEHFMARFRHNDYDDYDEI
ncbi:MAG: hypothetical protein J6Y90_07360 [Lachnospiraceae bacterium]|nr:hypothetical protein [Lachnospiraceae bacterium]